MGGAKQDQIAHHERVQAAASLCIEMEAIKPCEYHEDQMIDQMTHDSPTELMAEILKEHPDALDSFTSRADMLDCITEALSDAGLECGICENNRNS